MEVDEEPEGLEERSGCGGVLVLAAGTVGLLAAIFAISREAFILFIVVGGWGTILWAAKRVPSASNPAPPPVPERGSVEEPQVTMIRDQTHPNRWVILRPSRWLTADTDKTGTS